MRSLFSHLISAAALAVAGVSLAACGGGGGTSPGGTATLTGQVVSVDGTTSNLGGIRLSMPSTGQSVVTSASGGFSFGAVPAGTITIKVGTGAPLTAAEGEGEGGDDTPGMDDGEGENETEHENEDETEDESENHDADDDDSHDDGDGHDVGDDDGDVEGVEDGEDVHVTMSIRDGKIESFECSRSRDEDGGHDGAFATARLERSVESDDLNVEGYVRLEARPDSQRFHAEAEHLTPGREVEFFVLDGDTAQSQGVLAANAEGNAEWEMNTGDGDALPFDVATVEGLLGLHVEIRDAATGLVLLVGRLPLELPAPPATHEGGGDDGRFRGRALLPREDGVEGEAHIDIRSRPDEPQERIEVEVEGAVPGTTMDVLLEDPAVDGSFTVIGTLVINAEGRAELEIETEHGGSLPYGVLSVEALVGLGVEIRDGISHALLFSGHVPALVAD